ncbi:hypothetical protein IIA15_11500 [candidate division TA06 bacterium]|nr:hypothetical protein [candidate division TA06 bacterium]
MMQFNPIEGLRFFRLPARIGRADPARGWGREKRVGGWAKGESGSVEDEHKKKAKQ